ncbi:MAG: cytochrome c3 family protein [Desulfitobacteriaceae bacterium]|nr:cytochrome c3 family protein [Desulfitobacteriaceae bacterium]MDI6877826.1 cytochrome c3 family protein [Desulfitobacteriaceae bacterium]MDI6912773.1 cytochrome c3 family protein [Desulfitobacteriaceae bacterium]
MESNLKEAGVRLKPLQRICRWGCFALAALTLIIFNLMIFNFNVYAAALGPSVSYTLPITGDTSVGLNKAILVIFDSDIDPTTINASTFVIMNPQLQTITAQSITYDAPSRTAKFVPTAPLQASTKYAATVTTGVKDSLGKPLIQAYNWTFTTGTTPFYNPHGNYLSNTAACKSCHQTHTATGKSLLNKSAQTAVCYTCHDGTGSSYNIKAALAQTGPTRTYHPVMDTGNSSVQSVLQCTDCHNPHGDKDAQGVLYPRLLKVSDGTNTYFQGNGVCLACHGSVNRNFTPTYYQNTAGDHTSYNAVHYDITKSALLPVSGTKITCAQCHDKHTGSYGRLLNQNEENQCFVCHNNAANSLSNRNIQTEFALTGSTHDITSSTGAKVECSSCHGPHTVGAKHLSDNAAYSDLSDPSNTKKTFTTVTGTPNATVGTMTDFCLICHSGAPPVAQHSTTTLVPYSITFPSVNFTTNNGNNGNGWDKTSYRTSVHYQKGVGCEVCHVEHGSSYPRLQKNPEDTATVNGECLSCHGGSPPAQFASAPNVKTDLTQTGNGTTSPDRYRHPTLYNSGNHSDTEDYTTLKANGKRHAECLDCHDPHNEQQVTGNNAPPAAPPPLRNVTGVEVNYNGVTWNNWDTTKNWTFQKPIVNQYQLCFKCHSSYAWQNSPPTFTGSIQETDIPKEFNPNNPSYHAVVGTSKMPTFTYNSQTYYYGKFTANLDSTGQAWSATSRMYCEDCHSSGTTTLRGPHGSNYWYILKAPWTPNNGAEGLSGTGTSNTSNHVCFICHDYTFYANGNSGDVTHRSRFSGSSYPYNLHARHKGRGCTSCHVLVPHGYLREGLLIQTSDPAPYNTGAWLEIINWKTPGNWRQNDCNHGTILYGPNAGQSCG